MPEKSTVKRARRARQEGKAATTQAGAFVAEEVRHAKRGKPPVKSRQQAVAIGLSKARRAGVKVPKKSSTSAKKAPARSRAKSPKSTATQRHAHR